LGTPNGFREPVWWDLTGIGGGEEDLFCVRGVEAGRAGTNTGAAPVKVGTCAGIVGLEKIVEVGWLEEAKGKCWGTVCD
jgi:hypothetical protein